MREGSSARRNNPPSVILLRMNMEELEISLRSELGDLRIRKMKLAGAVGFFTNESEWVERMNSITSAIEYIKTRLREEF